MPTSTNIAPRQTLTFPTAGSNGVLKRFPDGRITFTKNGRTSTANAHAIADRTLRKVFDALATAAAAMNITVT